MSFREYPAKPWEMVLPGAEKDAIDLTKKLVCYESGIRMSAEEVSGMLSFMQ